MPTKTKEIISIGTFSDTSIDITRRDARQAFTIFTIIFVAVAAAIFGIMIWIAVASSSLPPPPQPEPQLVQTNVNPMIRTQEQCLMLPNAVWDDTGCGCQEPYFGDFCRERAVVGFNPVGSVKNLSVGSAHSTGASSIDDCSVHCIKDPDCKGFIYNESCNLFKDEIIANQNPGGTHNSLYIKHQSTTDQSFKITGRVFLAEEKFLVPRRFWEQDDTDYFAEIPLNQVKYLNFRPKVMIAEPYWGIFSKVPFDPNTVVPGIKSGTISQSDNLRFAYGQLPSLVGLNTMYVYFTN